MAAFGNINNTRALLAIGEAKWQEVVGMAHLHRLEHIRDLLVHRHEPGADSARLFLFSGNSFSQDLLKRANDDPGIQLIGLRELYGQDG